MNCKVGQSKGGGGGFLATVRLWRLRKTQQEINFDDVRW